MDSKMYLAENVLNERRTVTYRSLSRALKVHAHLAKQMLFEFHRNENAKKPHSVHATYLILGIQKPLEPPATNGHHAAKDEDEIMQSSPYLPSSMPNQEAGSDSLRTMSIIVAREEDLEDAKSTFQSISTIHVYSVQPTVLQDLNMLTDVSREDSSTHAHEDPLEYGNIWGMIQNTNVKRRTGARPPPPPAPKASVPAKRPLQKEAGTAKTETETVDEPASKQSSPVNDSQSSSSRPAAKPAPVKREKSNLFSSFAKAKPKQPKAAEASTESAQPSGAEDVVLDDGSEEEPEELFPDSGDKAASEHRESRKEREDKLKKMMEEEDADDEEMPDAEEEEPPREPTPVEEPSKPAELKEEVTVQGGRRRGKRQVMKKRTVKDEEGYLVTKQESVWESFSEDEPAPPKKKPAVNVAKSKPGKAGQGNIMSFFGKK